MTTTTARGEHFRAPTRRIILSTTATSACWAGGASIFRTGMPSTLAGFVEPGESFRTPWPREVYEEVKGRVKT